MFISLRTIEFPKAFEIDIDSYVDRLHRYSEGFPGLVSNFIAPSLTGATINAGQIVWRMVFSREKDAYSVTLDPTWQSEIAPLLEQAQVLGVHYRNTRSKAGKADAGIWRALVFRLMPQAVPEIAWQLEKDTLLMPRYVSTIRSWGLNTVVATEGPNAFTFVWEQEFDSLEGLTGEYMAHPVHWGIVDRYFDAECPEYVVDPYLLQLVCHIEEAIIS